MNMAGTDIAWQVLVVDDEAEIAEQVERMLAEEALDQTGRRIEVTIDTDFASGLSVLEQKRIDILVLDVRQGLKADIPDGPEAGNKLMAEVSSRRFVPVVFYTGLPHLIDATKSELVRVVAKDAGLEVLLREMKAIVATGVPSVNRALVRHLESVQRDYMWGAAEVWLKFKEVPDKVALAYLLARRLAASLAGSGIEKLTADLGNTDELPTHQDEVHPMFFYIIPPVDGKMSTGDVLVEGTENKEVHWVLLTNSCDLVEREKKVQGQAGQPASISKVRKADRVLLAKCDLLTEQEEYNAWVATQKDDGKLRDLIGNSRKSGQADRYMFLPGAVGFPDLVVDFQNLKSLPCGDLHKMRHLASMDSPYAEALVARFTRYYGRLGTPDLSKDTIIGRLTAVP